LNLNILSFIGWEIWLFVGLLLLVIAINRWVVRQGSTQYVFSFVLGSILSAILISFVHVLSVPGIKENAFLIAAGIVAIVWLWKFMFGPWGAHIKAAVLGTFVFWIAVGILEDQIMQERIATVIATLIALIPAGIWCLLFLKNHKERLSVVVLTFLAGMLSTVPILFYAHVVQKGYTLHFFLFKITPEYFDKASKIFVAQSLTGQLAVVSTSMAVSIVSFALVGVIEEWSKHWVIKKSDRAYFKSIDDVMQLSIIAAIGFAFAENIINPNYFIAFINDYLVTPESPRWGPFFGSVFGRSVITNMVHITCSGVLGYFYGLAFFARPVLEDDRAHGKRHAIVMLTRKFLKMRRVDVFRDQMMFMGLFWAITLHSAFDILVSLPEILPGHPQTVGQIFGVGGVLNSISLIMLPALTYVVGGWFLLMHLFKRKAGLKEYGYKLREEVFVKETASG
jgi:hypothetical protein